MYKVNWYNCLKYGTYRMAIRTSVIRRKNIYFSLLFGGGSKYGCGEDTLFVFQCIKAGIIAWAIPKTIGTVEQTTSTWFTGFNQKYFYDKGVLFKALSKKMEISVIPAAFN